MSAPFRSTESLDVIPTPDQILEKAKDACDAIMRMAELVVRLAHEDVTSADLIREGRRVMDGPRAAAENAIADLRSMSVQALSGSLPPNHGYADSMHLAEAVRDRLYANNLAAAAAGVRARSHPFEACSADAGMVRAAHARGAALVAGLPASFALA